MSQDWRQIDVDWNEHVPAPSEHSPRKVQIQTRDGHMIVHEEHTPSTAIKARLEDTVEVRE